jgi:hypothetical protein
MRVKLTNHMLKRYLPGDVLLDISVGCFASWQGIR